MPFTFTFNPQDSSGLTDELLANEDTSALTDLEKTLLTATYDTAKTFCDDLATGPFTVTISGADNFHLAGQTSQVGLLVTSEAFTPPPPPLPPQPAPPAEATDPASGAVAPADTSSADTGGSADAAPAPTSDPAVAPPQAPSVEPTPVVDQVPGVDPASTVTAPQPDPANFPDGASHDDALVAWADEAATLGESLDAVQQADVDAAKARIAGRA